MPMPKKIQYSGESKVINAIVNIANWLLDNYYELPIASSSVLGGVKVGQNLSIDENGVLSAESGGTTVVANPVGTPTDQLNTIQIGEGIYEIVGGGGSGASIEIIPITGGTNTTSRTFTFDRTPKKIAVTYDSADSSPWCGHWDFTWGDQYAFGLCNPKSVGQGATIIRAGLTYGADNKSFTVTGGNAFQAWNQSGSVRGGFMLVDYGSGGGTGGASEIADLEDVNITNPTDGQILKYDSQNSEWKNDNIPAATTNSLGLVKVGSGLSVYNGILSADNQVFNYGKVKNATFTNGWGSIGDPIYIYDPGLYLVGASADYGCTISSGEIGIRIRVGVSGSSSIYGEVRKTVSDPANESEYINTFVVVELTASTSTVSCDCYAGTSEYIKKGIVSHFAIKL